MTVTKRKRLALPDKWRNNHLFSFLCTHRETVLCLLFAAAALFQGLVYSWKVPFGQTPDEITHYQYIEAEFGTTGYAGELVNGLYFPAGLDKLPRNEKEKVDQAALEAASQNHFSTPLSLGSFHPQITAIRHLPCGIGFYLGIAFGLPMIWCTRLAEIFSVLFYTGIGFLIIRTTPVKKEIFAFCLLIPQVLQMCSSVNYDAVLIPCSFLLIAYILKLFYTETPVRWRNLALILFLVVVLALVKLPYALIGLILLIIPADQYRLNIGRKFEAARFIRKYRYLILLLLAAAVVGGMFLFRDTVYVKTILSDLADLPAFIALLRRNVIAQTEFHITQMVGMFGWLDSRVPVLLMIAFFIMMTYLNATVTDATAEKLNTGRRIWLIFVFFAMVLLIEVVFQVWSYEFMEWDTTADLTAYKGYISQLPTILGVQGRYWIPGLPVLLVGASGIVQRKGKKVFWASQIIYYAICFITVLRVLNLRYWVG